jgi:hypothetical protein
MISVGLTHRSNSEVVEERRHDQQASQCPEGSGGAGNTPCDTNGKHDARDGPINVVSLLLYDVRRRVDSRKTEDEESATAEARHCEPGNGVGWESERDADL